MDEILMPCTRNRPPPIIAALTAAIIEVTNIAYLSLVNSFEFAVIVAIVSMKQPVTL